MDYSTWFTELETFASQGVVKYLVANKTDKVIETCIYYMTVSD